MFRFEVSDILWLILILPFLQGIIYLFYSKQWKNATSDADAGAISRLTKDYSHRKYWIKNVLVFLSLVLLLVSWANPQWGNRKETVKVKSSDIVIALDISQSMLAEDISPNRMERAKFFVSELVKKLRGDRIGLIFFAGSAYLQMPLTSDYASAETFVKSASPSQAGTQGTVIAEAIELSESVFGETAKGQRALILISDGENHDAEAIAAAKKAKDNGVTVFTLGIGTEEGAFIPINVRGNRILKTDRTGNQVKTALNTAILKDIANAGGGNFYMIDPAMSALKTLDNALEKLEKQEVEQRSFTDFNSYFQLFLGLALLLLLIEGLLDNKKRHGRRLTKVLDI